MLGWVLVTVVFVLSNGIYFFRLGVACCAAMK